MTSSMVPLAATNDFVVKFALNTPSPPLLPMGEKVGVRGHASRWYDGARS